VLSTVAGIVVGCAAALVATSSMAAVLHGVRPADPLTFASVPLVLFAPLSRGRWSRPSGRRASTR
jgi:hypothetical protein